MSIAIHGSKKYVLRAAGVFVSAYVALCLCEFILWRMQPRTYRELYGDLHTAKNGNVVLKPGYAGRFDLGGAAIETRVNSHGYRGHEPSPNPKWRVLLLGDSFAFGALLDQSETIDARMEKAEPGLEVVNLGVIGYNLPQQLASLREWTLPADQVVYLFYYNDFSPPIPEMMVVDGYLLLRRHGDGTLLSEEEVRAQIARRGQRGIGGEPFAPLLSARLVRLRGVLGRAYGRVRYRDSSMSVNWWPKEKDQATMVSRSLAYTREMRDVVLARHMKFQVAIAPGVEEVREGRHFPPVTEFIAGLRAARISVLDLLPRLSPDDYWRDDPHFNPKGARIAADEIYQSLKDQ